ncbi:CheR family methyltransferase [Chitinimonas sp.]|uniref:CheR family methyltransferase n=1 Tax=Chitinimonas sp. TaxID=1934313 RepID=UPI0035AF6332
MNQEFPLSQDQFEQIRKLIYNHAGISLNEGKMPMVYSRLARRLRELNLPGFADYLALLQADTRGDEWQAFTNALTTNLTAFFREDHHFRALAQLAPHWHAQRRLVRVWCSAASTGEEPYSIAITLAECLPGEPVPARIIASDLDTNVLATASRAVYPLERLDKLSIERKRQFFLRGKGEKAGLVRVRSELRSLLEFTQINLLEKKWPLNERFDAIFCRNVMIYFDKPTQRTLLERFAPLLQPDGRLFVGHSEHLGHVADLYEHCGHTIYRLKRAA